MFGIARKIICFLKRSKEGWKTGMTLYRQSVGTLGFKRGIFQGVKIISVVFPSDLADPSDPSVLAKKKGSEPRILVQGTFQRTSYFHFIAEAVWQG